MPSTTSKRRLRNRPLHDRHPGEHRPTGDPARRVRCLPDLWWTRPVTVSTVCMCAHPHSRFPARDPTVVGGRVEGACTGRSQARTEAKRSNQRQQAPVRRAPLSACISQSPAPRTRGCTRGYAGNTHTSRKQPGRLPLPPKRMLSCDLSNRIVPPSDVACDVTK